MIKEKALILIEKALTCPDNHKNKYNEKDHELNPYKNQESVNTMYRERKLSRGWPYQTMSQLKFG